MYTSLSKLLIKYLYLILLVFTFEFIFDEISVNVFLNLLENILFALILIFLIYLFNNQWIKKCYFKISFVVFSLTIFLETAYYYLFKTNFSSSAIFVSLDSNSEEAKEFLGFYIDLPIVILAILTFIITSIVLMNTKTVLNKATLSNKLMAISPLVIILVFLKSSSLIVYNLPYLLIKSSIEYKIESKKLGDYKNNKTGDFDNVSRLINNDEEDEGEEVYIVVIGESTSKSHFGLYNYYRQTTPLLNEIKDELLIYKDVISPHTYTIASLTKAFTLSNYENPKADYKGTIIQLLNEAKFKTYWISNQKPIGFFDSQVTKMGLGAQKSFFLNLKHTNERTTFDEVLLEQLKKVVQEKDKKKVIFLHMLGAHIDYKKRYPEEFNYFDSMPLTPFNEKKVYDAINSYDNAIKYSDYIIREVIETTRELKVKSCVLYFSDHGEEVYEDIYFKGHSADQIITKNIYEIPVLLWVSDKFKKEGDIFLNCNSKYMIDDLFHSIADLLAVKADEVDSTRSIFNSYFKERKRIIKDTINYDTFFN